MQPGSAGRSASLHAGNDRGGRSKRGLTCANCRLRKVSEILPRASFRVAAEGRRSDGAPTRPDATARCLAARPVRFTRWNAAMRSHRQCRRSWPWPRSCRRVSEWWVSCALRFIKRPTSVLPIIRRSAHWQHVQAPRALKCTRTTRTLSRRLTLKTNLLQRHACYQTSASMRMER